MPKEVRVEIPADEGGEEAEHIKEDAPASQQVGELILWSLAAPSMNSLVVHINAWTSWNSALPILKHSLLPILTYSGPFWTNYHHQWRHHLPSHLGSSSELLHRLAEDVKLSAHGRHPTVYPFIFIVLVFTLFYFFFPVLLLCFLFRDKRVFQFKFGGVL
jgi:hypothetical protein